MSLVDSHQSCHFNSFPYPFQKLGSDYLLLVTLLQISCVDVSNDTGKIAVAYENKVRYVIYLQCSKEIEKLHPCLTNKYVTGKLGASAV
jgi:hypothetical protein